VGETVNSGEGTTLVIREVLGKGSFGTTYACERPELGDEVALKVLTLREMRDWKALQLFEREANTLKGLSHPAIPAYVDYFEVDSERDVKFCLVQKIAPGKSLQSLVDGGWRPTETEIVNVAEQLLEVLSYLSSLRPPVLHRDVKPGNVLLDRATGSLSLVDFGATAEAAMTAAVAEEGGGPLGSTVVGTFGYAAPEQMMGGATAVSDLYSAGATLLFLLTGRAPSTMPSARLRVDFRGIVTIEDPRLEAVVTRLLEPTPEDRYANARDALAALKSTPKKTAQETARAREKSRRLLRRRRAPWRTRWTRSVCLPLVSGGSSRPSRRIRKPSGTRVVVERFGSTKLVVAIPPAGVTGESASVGGFAVAWNAFVAFWTASALASGGGLLMAAFSIPFWLAGKEVASQAFAQIFEATRLELDAATSAYALAVTATGMRSSEKKGDLLDVRGVGDSRRQRDERAAGLRAAAGDWRRARDLRQGLAGGGAGVRRGGDQRVPRRLQGARGGGGVILIHLLFCPFNFLFISSLCLRSLSNTYVKNASRLPSPFPLDRSSFSSPEVAPVDVLPARGRVRRPGPRSDVPRVPALRHRALHVARPKDHSRGVAPSGLLLHGGPPGRAPLVVPVVVRLLLAAHEGHRAEGLVARQRGARRGARRRRPDGGRKRADGRVGE
jgi:serine/threonine protein kinase